MRHSSTLSHGARRRALVHPPRSIITWLPHAAPASQTRPVHVLDRLMRFFWPRARAGCAAWCSVPRLDVFVQMLAKEELGTVVRARPGPSPLAYDDSTCRPSSASGQGSVRAFAARQAWLPRRPFAVNKRCTEGCAFAGLLPLCVQHWRSTPAGSASRLCRVAGMPLWRHERVSALVQQRCTADGKNG